tara:strand:+ start:3470 stop:4210 length:741 start_codon:yes stop_codon:yes gene_type:complete
MDSVKKVERRGTSFLVYENESPAIPNFWEWDWWESYTYKVLESFLDKDHSYIDVGVHLGQTVLYGAKLAKTCHAIEPDPECLRITNKNIKLNNISNVNLIPKALGKDHENVRLGCPKACPSLGSSRTSHFFSEESNSFEVESVSLSSLIKNEKIDDLNFIKIDVEGMEDIVIENAPDIKVPIFIEIHTPWLSQGEDGYKKILDFMGRYKNITLFQDYNELAISLEVLSRMYVEKEQPEGFFTILGY